MPRPLHILFVYDCLYPDSVGGVERRNAELARALVARGHRVALAGWAGEGYEPPAGVELVRLGAPVRLYDARGRRRRGAALRLARQCVGLDVRRYDVVETAHVPYLHLPALALACRRARRPLVVSWYEVWEGYWRRYLGGGAAWRLAAGIERLAARAGVVATASSELTRGRLERLRGGPAELLPCGIDLERVDEVLARVGGGGHGSGGGSPPALSPVPPLLYAGRLVPEKRLDLLLRALALVGPAVAGSREAVDHRVRAGWQEGARPREAAGDRETAGVPEAAGLPEAAGATPAPLLAVVGDGPDRARLEALSRELGVERRVVFTGRLPSADDVWRIVARARVAVQPSAREGFGLFPLEAMAAGLPVVACRSDQNAVPELARPGREGLLADPTPASLAAALEGLLADPALYHRLATAARRRAEAYAWPAIAARAEEILTSASVHSPSSP